MREPRSSERSAAREDRVARVLPFRRRPEAEMRPPSPGGAPGADGRAENPRGAASTGDALHLSQEAAAHRRAEVTPLRRHHGERLRHSRRSLALRLAKPLLLAVVLVGGPALVAVWVFRSPDFALSEIDVSSVGGGRVSETWVRETLQPAQGWNLPRLPLPWIDDALRRHSWVRSTSLRKELPNRLSVRVIERREVALLARSGGQDLWYVDADGATIDFYDPADGETDLPLLTAPPGTDLGGALEILGDVEAARVDGRTPDWSQGLSEIEVLGKNDFRVWSAALPFPLLLRPGTLAGKTPYLEELLPEISRRYEGVRAVDLRFSNRIILQPAVRGSGRTSAGVHQRGSGR